MSVLVDTSIWSRSLRKKDKSFAEEEILRELVEDGIVEIIGPIRQEVLSGISDWQQFHRLKKILAYFPDLVLETKDFEKAAEFFNLCRKKGIQGSHTDFLICAVAVNYGLKIFTTDKDFKNYGKYIPIKLFSGEV